MLECFYVRNALRYVRGEKLDGFCCSKQACLDVATFVFCVSKKKRQIFTSLGVMMLCEVDGDISVVASVLVYLRRMFSSLQFLLKIYCFSVIMFS